MKKILLPLLLSVLSTVGHAQSTNLFVIGNASSADVTFTRLPDYDYNKGMPLIMQPSQFTPQLWDTTLKPRGVGRYNTQATSTYLSNYEMGVASVQQSNGSSLPICYFRLNAANFDYSSPIVDILNLDNRYHCEFDHSQNKWDSPGVWHGDTILLIKPKAASVTPNARSRFIVTNKNQNAQVTLNFHSNFGRDDNNPSQFSVTANSSKLLNMSWSNNFMETAPPVDDSIGETRFDVVLTDNQGVQQTICSGLLDRGLDAISSSIEILNPQHSCVFDKTSITMNNAFTLTVQ